jgi:hypothetical protein
MAGTLSDLDAKGKRLASGDTVFNQNSSFFSRMLGGQHLPGQMLKPTSSVYGLSLDEIRDLAVLHELFHVNDVNGEFDDNTNGNPTNLVHTIAINRLLRQNCGFSVTEGR